MAEVKGVTGPEHGRAQKRERRIPKVIDVAVQHSPIEQFSAGSTNPRVALSHDGIVSCVVDSQRLVYIAGLILPRNFPPYEGLRHVGSSNLPARHSKLAQHRCPLKSPFLITHLEADVTLE